MDDDEQQMLEHPRKPAYVVKLRSLFRAKCDHHPVPYRSRRSHSMGIAIARMQEHNERVHA